MTKQTSQEYRASRNFTKQIPIAQYAKAPEAGLLLHRFRGMSLFCKVIVKKNGIPIKIKKINYKKLITLIASDRLMVHTIERGVLKFTNREWNAVQALAAMSVDEKNRFDEKLDEKFKNMFSDDDFADITDENDEPIIIEQI